MTIRNYKMSINKFSKVKFVKIQADQNIESAQKYSISGLPCMLIFKNGEPVERSRISFNPSKCDQCGDCIEACPYDMIHKTDNPKLPIAGFCTLCGQCLEACPEDALCYK